MAENEKNEIISRLVRIETKLEPLVCINDKVHDTASQCAQNTKDIAEIKDNNKWLWGSIIGTFIALLSSIISYFIKI